MWFQSKLDNVAEVFEEEGEISHLTKIFNENKIGKYGKIKPGKEWNGLPF